MVTMKPFVPVLNNTPIFRPLELELYRAILISCRT